MTENILDRELVKEFRETSQCSSNLESYENYYKACVQFINKNKDYFIDSILKKWGLDVLISIDAEEYIVSKLDLSLNMEKIRLSKGAYENIDTLAMSIRDTLWDMITVYSGKDCPITPADELRYIKLIDEDGIEKLLLECAGCGWTEELNGEEYKGSFGKVFPVNKREIEKYRNNVEGLIL